MTNAEWIMKQGYKFTDLFITYFKDGVYKVSACGEPIAEYKATNEITYLEVILKWLDMEHVEPILNDAERRYLSAVIKPFRDDVTKICKGGNGKFERIAFTGRKYFFLPSFNAGTMYKGMELGCCYKLDELGL